MRVQCYRLGSRSLLSTIGRIPTTLNSSQYAQAAAGAPKITFQKAELPKTEHYDDKNARLNRPLSPHLSIYEIQLTTTLSITHRATGKFNITCYIAKVFLLFFCKNAFIIAVILWCFCYRTDAIISLLSH